ncbi:unnamed protein product [Parascedosporium putredinis]|uniref:Alpha-acetolactate decarboxylase n=1 Tax=Parascedosporium putredinis TaxID=1442378 RepID=A0A9P1ME62_9PEZI|nr:unnamed protein product [Parascedosporium putredinis]CAI8004013.1 unnamed protein product [Parascedosporium putredinis]
MNKLYQYSVISALMEGVAGKGLPLSSLLARGDHGIGTFRTMLGELIVVDGKAYQMLFGRDSARGLGQGRHRALRHDHPVPAQERHKIHPRQQGELGAMIASLFLTGRNSFVAFRIDGAFRSVQVRTVSGQSHPKEGLGELAARQPVHSLTHTRGTVVGFRSPAFLQGVSVAGLHMHFIDEKRERGGHVLSLETEGDVTIRAADVSRSVLDLPRDDTEYNDATIKVDLAAIEAAEGLLHV